MTPDEGFNDQPQRPDRRGGGGGGFPGGGGGLGGFLPALLGMLFKRPKLLLILLAVLAVLYFVGGQKGCNVGGGGGSAVGQLVQLMTGAKLDPKMYDKAEVYEPLTDNVKDPLPERFTLERFAPQRRNQGQQGSCVAWASGYAARSIVQAEATKADPNSTAFSPSYLYNQIKLDGNDCQGSYILRAMENMQKGGILPFSQFAYTDENCSKLPSDQQKEQAQQYRIKGFQRLSVSGDDQEVDLVAMKQQLSHGAPVVIGMMVGGTFMQEMMGQDTWTPDQSDYQRAGFGGHAMCVIGYDDFKFGNEGGFQLMNSWGPEWGNNGTAWVRYGDFKFFCKEAYAMYPLGEGVDVKPQRFDIRFGLAEVDAKGQPTGGHIALKHQDGRVFRTDKAVTKGTRFKVEVTNNAECYTYLLGLDTDGSTYVLFPYTPKHSPYCGITGTRVFPKDQSLTADEVGTTDEMAILVTNQPFDYPKINELLKANAAKGLDAKLAAVLGNELTPATEPTYAEGETFGANAPTTRNALAIVLEIDKR